MTEDGLCDDGWREVIAPLAGLVDLDDTARTSGALVRRRGVPNAGALLRLAFAWGPGGLSLRQAAAWAGMSAVADLCDSALLRRLRKAGGWLETLLQAVLESRAAAVRAPALQGRLIRLVDGSTFGVVGSDKMGRMTLTSADEGEGLARIPVTAGELRIADRGFARPDGLRHMVDHGADLLIRMGSRSLKLEDGEATGLDLMEALAVAERDGVYDDDVFVRHGRKGRKTWPPLPMRLVIVPLPPEAAKAARQRLQRAGQRERYTPSPLAVAAAGHVMLITSLGRDMADADTLLALYRLRWQVELAFKRIKSLLGMRTVPTKDPDLARTWLCANLLVALLAEDFGADLGDSPP